jgi:hypothetical protein
MNRVRSSTCDTPSKAYPLRARRRILIYAPGIWSVPISEEGHLRGVGALSNNGRVEQAELSITRARKAIPCAVRLSAHAKLPPRRKLPSKRPIDHEQDVVVPTAQRRKRPGPRFLRTSIGSDFRRVAPAEKTGNRLFVVLVRDFGRQMGSRSTARRPFSASPLVG